MNGYIKSKDSIFMSTCIKNQRTVYEWVNILVNQVYEWVYFCNDQVYDWGRFQKFGRHTRTTITPVTPELYFIVL